jgi:hypothetical protein
MGCLKEQTIRFAVRFSGLAFGLALAVRAHDGEDGDAAESRLSRLDENQSSLTWFFLEDAWRLWIAWTLSSPRS